MQFSAPLLLVGEGLYDIVPPSRTTSRYCPQSLGEQAFSEGLHKGGQGRLNRGERLELKEPNAGPEADSSLVHILPYELNYCLGTSARGKDPFDPQDLKGGNVIFGNDPAGYQQEMVQAALL